MEGDLGPLGISMSYLISGSPCVVGNLWDVTDVDSDNYNSDLLDRFLGGKSDSLCHAAAEARGACKLSYIVGGAPVCYGLPILLKQE